MTQNKTEACQACIRGPRNIDGHDGLFTHSFSSSIVVFKCAKCGVTWSRSYTGSGQFAWSQIDAPETLHQWGGVSMPPRGHGR